MGTALGPEPGCSLLHPQRGKLGIQLGIRELLPSPAACAGLKRWLARAAEDEEPPLPQPLPDVRLMAPGDSKKQVGMQLGLPSTHLLLKGLRHSESNMRERLLDAALTASQSLKPQVCHWEPSCSTTRFVIFLGAPGSGTWAAPGFPAAPSMCTGVQLGSRELPAPSRASCLGSEEWEAPFPKLHELSCTPGRTGHAVAGMGGGNV